MNLKLGLMHYPKPPDRAATKPVTSARPRREAGAVEGPVEFLMRIREAQRRSGRDWKGVLAS